MYIYKILNTLGLLFGAFVLIVGLLPVINFFITGSLETSCGDVAGLAYTIAAVVLIISLFFVDKKYPSLRNLIFAFILAFLVFYIALFIIRALYGMDVTCPGFGPY